MLLDIPPEILVHEIVPLFIPSSFFALCFTQRGLKDLLLVDSNINSLVRLFGGSRIGHEEQHRWLTYWAFLSFNPHLLASLLVAKDLNAQRETVEECYVLMMLKGHYDAARPLRTLYHDDNRLHSPFNIHRGAFRYMATLKYRSQIYTIHRTPMNDRLSRMVGLFMYNYNSLRGLARFLIITLSDDQLVQILRFPLGYNRNGCNYSMFTLQSYILKQLLSNLRYSLSIPIRLDYRSLQTTILGHLVINSDQMRCRSPFDDLFSDYLAKIIVDYHPIDKEIDSTLQIVLNELRSIVTTIRNANRDSIDYDTHMRTNNKLAAYKSILILPNG